MERSEIIDNSFGRKFGFEKYKEILELASETDLSGDLLARFERLFNDYYDVRRNEDWRNIFYSYFLENRSNKELTFEQIIEYLYDNAKTNHGRKYPVEASFSSKMLSVINPNMPIIDSQVLKNMGLTIAGKNPLEKSESAKVVYKTICDRYNGFLKSPECQMAIEYFDLYFPNYKEFSIVKKLDWFLWSMEREELIGLGIFGELINE